MILAKPIWDQGRVKRESKKAFVLMPFREKWSSYIYSDYIAKALRDHGLSPQRADEMYGRNVLQDIWSGIISCRLVVADLSAPNENVFYELGIAHTVGKPTILLTQSIDRIPFDLRAQRMISYTDDHPGYNKLMTELPGHIASILAEPIDEVHHVVSTLGGYLITLATESLVIEDEASLLIEDSMDIIGTRDNVVLVNKVIETDWEISDVSCNHRHAHSIYPDLVRVAALFDPPYVQVGTRTNVTFRYRAKDYAQDKSWSYDCSLDTERLRFRLVTPSNYNGVVRIVQVVKPTEYSLSTLAPQHQEGVIVFEGDIFDPKVGSTYAIRWT